MGSAPEVVRAAVSFPLRNGELAGCDVTLTLPVLAEFCATVVPATTPCEGRCGALVGESEVLSGEQLKFRLPGPLRQIGLPVGLWEPPRDDVDDEGAPVQAVVFHSPDRCRELRDRLPGDRAGPSPVYIPPISTWRR